MTLAPTIMKNQIITSEILGKALIPDQAYVNPDTTPISIDKDFLGNSRSNRNPRVGPFENMDKGVQKIKVWKYVPETNNKSL